MSAPATEIRTLWCHGCGDSFSGSIGDPCRDCGTSEDVVEAGSCLSCSTPLDPSTEYPQLCSDCEPPEHHYCAICRTHYDEGSDCRCEDNETRMEAERGN